MTSLQPARRFSGWSTSTFVYFGVSRTRVRHGSRALELRGGAAHGWQYAAIYLDLVHFCMGKEAADALKAAFKDHKVRFRPKRQRTVTPQQIERLAAM